MFRFNNRKVQIVQPLTDMPSFKMEVDMKIGPDHILAEDASLTLTFESREDIYPMIAYLSDKIEVYHISVHVSLRDNVISIKGNSVERSVPLLLNFCRRYYYMLPTDALCKFARYFEENSSHNIPALDDLVCLRFYTLHAQNEVFREILNELSKKPSETNAAEVKETAVEEKSTVDPEELLTGLQILQKLEKENKDNEELYQAIKAYVPKLEKKIADRNKITNAIRSVLRVFLRIKGYDGDRILKRDVERLKTETADLSTPSAPRDRLNRYETVHQLLDKLEKLIAREEKSLTVEEHARDLLRSVAREFTSVYKRAVSETSKEIQQIVREIVPGQQRRPSIFSSNSGESLKNSETPQATKPTRPRQK